MVAEASTAVKLLGWQWQFSALSGTVSVQA